MIHHKAWVDGVELGLYGLKASLLTRHPETKVHKFILSLQNRISKDIILWQNGTLHFRTVKITTNSNF